MGPAMLDRRVFVAGCIVAGFALRNPKACAYDIADLNVTAPMGITTEVVPISQGMQFNTIVDKKKFIEFIPTLQSLGYINPELSQTFLNGNSTMIAAFQLQRMTPALLHEFYKSDPKVDSVEGHGFVSLADDFGHLERHEAFNYGFSRNIYTKINWDAFDENKFNRVSKNFRYTAWLIQNRSEF